MRFDNSGVRWTGMGRRRFTHAIHSRFFRSLFFCFLIGGFLSAAGVVQGGEEKRFEVTIADRKVAKGGPTIRVTEGDRVVIVWHSDEIGELHLHGYDISIALNPDEATETVIDAQVAGRFPLTSHGFGGESHSHGKGALLYFEVYPE